MGIWFWKHPLVPWNSWCWSMVVDHLSAVFRNNKDIGVACIYLNHQEVDNQTPSKLLAALWRQLVLNRDISSIAKNLYKQHREKGTTPSLKEVVSVLKSSITELSKVFIIIDAMDEYPESQRHILLEHLAEMGSKVNSMITSRPNISPEPFSFPNLETLDIQATPEDIQAYIDAQIKISPRLSKHIQKKPVLRDEILTKITDTVAGMFLLARLHIESLSEEATIKAVQEALKHLPKGLNATYDSAMKRIEGQGDKNKQIAYSTLTWVVNAKRPLSVSEIQTALAVEPDSRELDKDNVMEMETILTVCAGLIIVDKDSLVRLVHYTTQEYLDKIQAEKFPDAQTEITRTLLTFLAFDRYPDPSWKSGNLPPLVNYSEYCLAHAAGQPEVHLREILLEFLDQAPQWRQNHRWYSPPWDYQDWPSKPSRLWIAVAANLTETAKYLLDQAPVQQHLKNPEIIVAAYYGHAQMIHVLLQKGANINAQGEDLCFVVIHLPYTSRCGAYIDTQCGGYISALHAAIVGGNVDIVEFLVGYGANMNADELPLASFLGEIEIVEKLQQKVDLDSQGGFYGRIFGTGLQAAALAGRLEVVQLLLHRGADVNTGGKSLALESSSTNTVFKGGYHGTALQAAALVGNLDIVQLLLHGGADVNARGGYYGTALQAAALVGNLDMVELLLHRGADVNAGDGHYGTALQAALYQGQVETAELLLEWNVDVNAKGNGPTALQAALYGGHVSIASMLLSRNADVNAKAFSGGHYPTALQAALYGGHWPIAQLLLDMGADVNSQGGCFPTALQAALYGGHVIIAKSLLEKGADVNAQGKHFCV
ncbi:NACHT and ankyrin domain protein [Mycena venus]|uniref:NACHT and ankyrin domain protein n=1 Tax=Mycena venus TaxID=2733690 RepID=A0A8H6XXT4_9AGAR|nr:NACHT and ankyrin domain protein [Mycena venus]